MNFKERNTAPKEEKTQIIFGLRAIMEALTAGKELDRLMIQDSLNNALANDLKKLAKEKGVAIQFVPVERINRVTSGNHQGAVAFVSLLTYHNVSDIIPPLFEAGKTPLILILDRITDVRNFGAIARTAECAGVDAIILPLKGTAQINADAIKTSAGALHRIPVCKEPNLKFVIDYLKQSGLQIVSCTEKAETLCYKADLTLPTAIILGSEEDGISPEYLKRSDIRVKLPMVGSIGSLNVSVANGVILYEALRQRLNS